MALSLIAFAVLPGCATPVASASTALATPAPARVEMVNLSACAWRVVFTSPGGHEVSNQQIPLGETRTVTLPAGDYTITQTALSGLPTASATRRLPLALASGDTYRWPLATLLTTTPDP